jgi:signal transduction histidine kinase
MAGFAGFCAIAGLVLVVVSGNRWDDFFHGGHADAPGIAIVGGFFGALIVRRRPHNPIGWLLLANALAQGLHVAANQYGVYALGPTPGVAGGDIAAWLSPPPLIIASATLIGLLLLFPDGRLVSRLWGVLAYVAVADLAVSLLAVGASCWSVRGVALLDGHAISAAVQAPVAVSVIELGRLTFAIVAGLAVASVVLRYRRSHGVERQQLKWYVYGAAISVLLVIVSRVLSGSLAGMLAAVSPIPILTAIYLAMRRYGLYDIDRIVSRTVTYAGLTVILAAVYVAAATLLAWSFASISGGSTLAVAGSAVCAAALFQPVRRRLQDFSDHAFRRRSYAAGQVIARYLQTLQERQPAPGALRVAVAEALGDPEAMVGLRLPGQGGYVDEEGGPFEPGDADDNRVVSRVDRGGEHLGILVHDRRIVTTDPDVLATTVRSAAAAMDHARLRAQVGAQLAEVRASRARIVGAADAERRRIERDLHDGAQQRLLAAALSLRRLEARPGGETASVGDAANQVETALVELRRIAHGLAPVVLSEQGLAAAIESLADLASTPITVDTAYDARYPQDIETTAYYVVAEALANVAKHAHAEQAQVHVYQRDGALHVEVSDDGEGGASMEAGSGLVGLRDRIDAAGGSFVLESPRRGGTLIAAILPMR